MVKFDAEKDVVLVRTIKDPTWKDITYSINRIEKRYYYGNFSGYNIVFKSNNIERFYKKDNVQIVERNKVYNEDISNYFKDLADYAGEISTEGEPLNLLSSSYNKIKPIINSTAHKYFMGKYQKKPYNKTIITPFNFNQSQFEAIKKALNNDISVIEGPPGTGKTQVILNIVANILKDNLNCAVISNNNTAINNVFDKLDKNELSFAIARLGNASNTESFFEDEKNDDLNKFLNISSATNTFKLEKKLDEITQELQEVYENKIKLAKYRVILANLLIEQKNFYSLEIPNIKINENLKPRDYLKLMLIIEKNKKVNWFKRFLIKLIYKVNLNEVNHSDLSIKLQELYYLNKIKTLNWEIETLEKIVNSTKNESMINESIDLSKKILESKLHDKYKNISEKSFKKDNYKRNYKEFIERYPVVLSTSYSLFNNMPSGFLFDYLIIDEASQGDLLSSVLAMNCAKNLIVVGDSKQLQQIDEVSLYNKAEELQKKYNIKEAYNYKANSIIKSIKSVITDVPTTLLKEHYRSPSDIISFCNKMFYDGELIPMKENSGTHMEIIKTVPGNHARKNPYGTGMYNQREIDELKHVINNNYLSETGVITPFRYQADLIKDNYKDTLLEADTIHKFQGREKDHVVLSFVINSLESSEYDVENKLYDFITNKELLNVAISRAKNKLTLIVSDKVYDSKNNVIKDLINYIEYLYGDIVTKKASSKSVFDILYQEYNELVIQMYQNNKKLYLSELIMRDLIEEVTKNYNKISYHMHVKLNGLIKDIEGFNDDEIKYIKHPWTHVDFLFYNKVTKEKLFVIEVDGVQYHEQNEKQRDKDEIKNRVLLKNNINIYRFRTNESNEKERLISILETHIY